MVDAKGVASIQSSGGSFKGGSVRKSSSYNTLVSESTNDSSLYSSRKCTSDDNSDDIDGQDVKSDNTLLQDLLDEILD